MEIELTGIDIPREYNHCSIDNCEKQPSTAVWGGNSMGEQLNVCNYHLKEKLDSGEWTVSQRRLYNED